MRVVLFNRVLSRGVARCFEDVHAAYFDRTVLCDIPLHVASYQLTMNTLRKLVYNTFCHQRVRIVGTSKGGHLIADCPTWEIK